MKQLDVACRREGSGPPLLFLHGHWLAGDWTPLHAALAGRLDVIAPTAPGFGDSARPAWVSGRDDLVLFYRDLLDQLGLDKVHVAGYGLGGWLAADFAVWSPDRVASLSVLAPFGLRVPGHPIADVFIMNPASYDEAYFNGEPVEGAVPGPGTPDQGGPEAFAARYGDMGMAAALMWDFRYDLKLEHRLPRLGVPALVIEAEQDRIVPAQHTARWTELLDARRVDVPGGHGFPLAHPERTAAHLIAFIEGIHQ
ncbi:alpha/beta fold hydrolase [Nonomuraea soli]|uniref:Pimeloyl-ACP methyl ester carboxylesterase n=1 Tax=Nonomuraea soli TaxID=1032476 RepID=A0A7W0CFA2_9ACTN|nr:alpha/beta fold hydrolase [Nonomuraea soli]MBA2890121.1 pimeloyl-ACP methyl ester carboxylesterase [Nonomuraea soli]